MCKCSASGDPHYKTFDKLKIHFQGICTYRLMEAWHGDCGMIVNVKNIQSAQNPKVAYTRTVYVMIGNDTITIDQRRKVTVNHKSINSMYIKKEFSYEFGFSSSIILLVYVMEFSSYMLLYARE